MATLKIENNQSPVSVVVGGSSFLGLAVSQSLIEKGSIVVVIDNQEPRDSDFIELVKQGNSAFFIKQSPGDDIKLDFKVDYIFYLRAFSLSTSQQVDKFLKDVNSTLNFAIKNNIKYLFASNDIDLIENKKTKSPKTLLGQISNNIESAKEAIGEKFNVLNARIVNLSHLYGSEFPAISQTKIQVLFSQIKNQTIMLANDGAQLVTPVFLKDAAEAIIQSMFSISSKSKTFYFTGQTTQPLINFAFLVNRLASETDSGELTIKSYPAANQKQVTALPVATNTKFEEGISETLNWIKGNQDKTLSQKASESFKKRLVVKRPSIKKRSKTPVTKNKKSKKLWWGISLGLFLLTTIFLYPFIVSYVLITSTQRAIEERQLDKIVKLTPATINHLEFSKKNVGLTAPIIDLFFKDSSKNLLRMIEAGETLLKGVENISLAAIDGNQAVKIVLAGQINDPFPLFNSANSHLAKAFQEFSVAQSSLSLVNVDHLPTKKLKDLIETLSQKIPELRKQLTAAQKITSILPELLGKDSSKTYLILLQNNAELRATGGFIGSFALVSFDKGKLLDVETHDVYTADGQLRGHVEPPEPIKKYLGEANWYLRDVNWDPHFPTTARQAEWFLDKEMGRQVDGTVAINLYVIESLLDAFGPVNLTDYQETISSSNLFQRAEFHSEVNYFEGSTQKKDFIASLINAIHTQIITSEQQTTEGLLLSLINNADQSHFQASFRNQQAEAIFSDLGFNGGQLQASCPPVVKSKNCVADYLSIIESNFGVNKVNYFINRKISHQVKFLPNNTKETVTLTLVNTATSNTWPAGTYKNYMRVFTPSSSTLNSVTVDDSEIDPSQITISRKNNKTIFGFFTQTPINSQSTIVIDYNLNQTVLAGSSFGYSLLYEKQSGTGPDELNLLVTYPSNYLPITILPSGSYTDSQTQFKSDTNTDRSFVIELTN
jgi:nucleoside-diphosphate-sugar epimerase